MKRIIFAVLFIAASNFFLAYTNERNFQDADDPKAAGDSITVIAPEGYHPEVDKWITTILSRYHYKKQPLNDSLSSVIFDKYLNALDHSKSYFLQSDIVEFERYREEFDDLLLKGNLDPIYHIYNRFIERVQQRMAYVDKALEKDFDFTADEEFKLRRDEDPWPRTEEEANEFWRKRLKYDALNLKLAGKEEESIKETLRKRYDNFKKNIYQWKSEDVFQIAMNSYSEAIDPHTNYLSPITSDNFKINMSLSLEGIGAQLQSEDDYTKIAEIIPGGPAAKSGLLHRNDKIIGVAQGDDGEMVDVIGWRLNDVVQLIRGPKESVVRLSILKGEEGANALPKEIKIVRDKVKLEEQSAKKEILEIEHEDQTYRMGVINIPAFYLDFEAQQKGIKDFKSTTRDVKKLIKELKSENVDGVIIDLRNNGGGSLSEAIELTGLFIKDGPVVQVRNADGSIDIGDDPDPEIVYDGPLAVLVNRFSASASEIFAGAIQDYGRGIIIGEQTFGKGTVQNLIDLNRVMPGSKDKLGQIKLTIAKYYRIDGGSTQHLGVVPDIQFPSPYEPDEFGESSEPSALPWDQISPTMYEKYGDLSAIIPQLQASHKERFFSGAEYDYLLEDIEEYRASRDRKYISLNEEVRKKEKEELEEKRFKRENDRRKSLGVKLLQKGEDYEESDSSKDPILNESSHILADYIQIAVG
jgi:carboxyl-terminal processing protease